MFLTRMLETTVPFSEAVILRSILGALLIGLLLIVTVAGRKVIPPRVRFRLWLLVPLQLLWCIPVPSSLSLLNGLPDSFPTSNRKIAFSPAEPQQAPQKIPDSTQPPAPSADDIAVADVTESFDRDEDFWSIDETSEIQDEIQDVVEPVSLVENAENTATWRLCVAAIWLLGAALFYGIYFVQMWRFQCWIRSSRTLTDQNTLRLFERCKGIMRINAWVMLVESPKVRGPFLIGVFRPVIVLPRGLVGSLNDPELQHLFSHELAHLKRSDLSVGWLMVFVLGLYWFNPLVWLAVRMMNQLREEAADAMVLDSLEIPGTPEISERKLDYAATLLTVSRKFANPRFVPGIAGVLETRSFLQRRIDMITQPGTWRKRWSLLAAGFCLGLTATLVTDAKPQTKPVYETKLQVDAPQPIEYTVAVPQYENTAVMQQFPSTAKVVPATIATFPVNKATNVDPNITQVYVTFDVPMGEGRAWAQRSNQTALDFDEDLEMFWTADRRTCVAPVKLKPNKTYEILMNFPPFIGFASEAGVPSRQFLFTFKTGRGPVTEDARAEHAAKNLTENSKSPAVAGFTPEEDDDANDYVSAELEAKGRQALKVMAERGKYWIFSQCREAESWSYHFTNGILDENGDVKPDSLQEYDIEVDRKGSAPWEKIRGITWYSHLQALASLVVNEQTVDDVRFKAVTVNDNEVVLHFVVRNNDLGCRIGNGMNGSWYGFFQSRQNEGQLTLDRKTMTPKTLLFDKGNGERYGRFVAVGKDVYVPQRIQVKNGGMLFDMYFNVYEPGLWLLDQSIYTVKVEDEGEFRSRSEVNNVQINGKPGKLIEK